MIQASEYKTRRERLFNLLEEDSCAILFSGVAKTSTADEYFDFEVNRNFYYLTGIKQDDAALILIKTAGEKREFLLVPPFDPLKEKWYGKRITIEEAQAASGIKNVILSSALPTKVDSILGKDAAYGEVKNLYIDLEDELKIAKDTYTTDFANTTVKVYPHVCKKDVYPLVIKLRGVKSESEVEEFRKAIESTSLGIKAVMAMARPGLKEYELANTFLHVINDDNAYQGLAFPTIMASGVNATCLHYPTPLDTIKDGDLVLMDLGARSNFYNADVTRCFPANGKFSDKQRLIYSIVLGCNKAVAAYAKPGVGLKELQQFTINYLAGECLTAGLIKTKEEIKDYYFHSISHHIGLDTHDPMGRDTILEVGNIISDEPGLYFKELGIGVRIEDDLLITENGCEVLTSGIIKEIEDIEKFFKSARKK